MTNKSNDIERYLNNQMTDAERHALEKRALTDPFLADALEGAETLSPPQFTDDMMSLKKRLASSRRATYFMIARIAAGLAFLVTAGWLIWLSQTEPTESLAVMATDSSSVKADDTASQMLSLAKPEAQPSTPPTERQSRTREAERKPAPAPTEGPVAAPPATIAKTEHAEDKATTLLADEPATEIAAANNPGQVPAARSLNEKAEEEKASAAKSTERAEGDLKEEARDRATKDDKQLAAGQSSLKKTGEPERSHVIIYSPTDPTLPGQPTELAAPAGGVEAYRQYLERFQKIPERARSASAHGRVTVSFTVGPDGALKEFVVLQSVGFGCDEELIRLIKDGPAWKPAYGKEKPLQSSVSVSLDF